jgi:hypothetical protein
MVMSMEMIVGAVYFLLGVIGWFLKGVIDESKDMLSSLGAARNVNPPKIGYRV